MFIKFSDWDSSRKSAMWCCWDGCTPHTSWETMVVWHESSPWWKGKHLLVQERWITIETNTDAENVVEIAIDYRGTRMGNRSIMLCSTKEFMKEEKREEL